MAEMIYHLRCKKKKNQEIEIWTQTQSFQTETLNVFIHTLLMRHLFEAYVYDILIHQLSTLLLWRFQLSWSIYAGKDYA